MSRFVPGDHRAVVGVAAHPHVGRFSFTLERTGVSASPLAPRVIRVVDQQFRPVGCLGSRRSEIRIVLQSLGCFALKTSRFVHRVHEVLMRVNHRMLRSVRNFLLLSFPRREVKVILVLQLAHRHDRCILIVRIYASGVHHQRLRGFRVRAIKIIHEHQFVEAHAVAAEFCRVDHSPCCVAHYLSPCDAAPAAAAGRIPSLINRIIAAGS